MRLLLPHELALSPASADHDLDTAGEEAAFMVLLEGGKTVESFACHCNGKSGADLDWEFEIQTVTNGLPSGTIAAAGAVTPFFAISGTGHTGHQDFTTPFVVPSTATYAFVIKPSNGSVPDGTDNISVQLSLTNVSDGRVMSSVPVGSAGTSRQLDTACCGVIYTDGTRCLQVQDVNDGASESWNTTDPNQYRGMRITPPRDLEVESVFFTGRVNGGNCSVTIANASTGAVVGSYTIQDLEDRTGTTDAMMEIPLPVSLVSGTAYDIVCAPETTNDLSQVVKMIYPDSATRAAYTDAIGVVGDTLGSLTTSDTEIHQIGLRFGPIVADTGGGGGGLVRGAGYSGGLRG